jgi:hypothetical protein
VYVRLVDPVDARAIGEAVLGMPGVSTARLVK